MNDRHQAPSDARIRDAGSLDEKQTAIMVLGMHRAGSSVLTRLLGSLGCTLSQTMRDTDHPSEAIRSFDDGLLDQAGSSWTDWQPMQEDWSKAPTYRPNARKAGQILKREFGDAPLFALGDPRICRIAPFWFEVLDSQNIETITLLPIRHPFAVAAALEGSGVAPAIGQLLWLRHVLDAEVASRGRRRMFVRYDDLLGDGIGLADRIAARMGLVWPRSRAAFAADLMDIIGRDATGNAADRPREHIRSDWLRDTYAIMTDWACNGEDADEHAKLDAMRLAFDEAGANFAHLADTLAWPPQHAAIARRDGRASTDGPSERSARRQPMSREDISTPESGDLQPALVEADARLDRLVTQLAAAHDKIARSAARTDAVAREEELRTQHLARSRATIDARDATIETMTQQLRLKTREIDDLQRQIEQFVTGRRTPAMSDIGSTATSTDHRGAVAQPYSRIGQDDAMLQQAFLESMRNIAGVLSMPGKWWWSFLPTVWTRRLKNRALRRKGLFDAKFYRKHYPDVVQAGLDPLNHYVLHGLEEGRLRS